jgi:hypothetical protein
VAKNGGDQAFVSGNRNRSTADKAQHFDTGFKNGWPLKVTSQNANANLIGRTPDDVLIGDALDDGGDDIDVASPHERRSRHLRKHNAEPLAAW